MRKKRTFHKIVQNKDLEYTYIQPFKEKPSVNNSGKKNEDRMNAHELFSQYTADIIKEDVIFSR